MKKSNLRFYFWCGSFFGLCWIFQHCFCFVLWFFGWEACWSLAPWPEIEPTPPDLEGKVLTTGLPGKPLKWKFLNKKNLFVLENQLRIIKTASYIAQLLKNILSNNYSTHHILSDLNVFSFSSVYWICYNIAFVLCFDFFGCDTWDLSSLTKDQTCIRRWSLNHWTTRDAPCHKCLYLPFKMGRLGCWLFHLFSKYLSHICYELALGSVLGTER